MRGHHTKTKRCGLSVSILHDSHSHSFVHRLQHFLHNKRRSNMTSFGRIAISRVLIFLWWTTATTTTLLLLSSSSRRIQCFAAATEDAVVTDTAEGGAMAADAVAATAETQAATSTDESNKKDRVLRKTWTLFHSVDSTGQSNDTSFTPRAKVTLEVVVVNDIAQKATTTPPVLTIENHADCLSQESVHRMMETQWYQLKLVEDADDSSRPPPILATVPACRMRLANFR
jgi:hypothetical protein